MTWSPPYPRFLCSHASPSADTTSLRQSSTVVFTIENNPHVSGPTQFKLTLFKGQLYYLSSYMKTLKIKSLKRKQEKNVNIHYSVPGAGGRVITLVNILSRYFLQCLHMSAYKKVDVCMYVCVCVCMCIIRLFQHYTINIFP